ncbi:MAG: ABC transporter permease [Anaerolineae bacterium]|jgi:ABC-2 type transport system permease protein
MTTAISTIWSKHMTKFVKNGEEWMATLFMPILWILLFGAGMKAMMGDMPLAGTNIAYIAFITPGIVALTALSGAVNGGATLLDEKLRGILKEYLVAPIPRLSILLGNMLSNVTKSLLQAVIILLVAVLMGAALTGNPFGWLLGLVLMLVFALGFVGIASAVAMRAPNTGSYHALIFLLNLPLLFASNALYPLQIMPTWLKVVSYINPTTYIIDLTRGLWFGTPMALNGLLSVGVVLAWGFLGTYLAYFSFSRAVR